MSKKGKPYVMSFIDPRIMFYFLKKIVTPYLMKARIQKLSKKDNWKGSKCVEGL